MPWWLLIMVGLSMCELEFSYDGHSFNLAPWFRLITFILCCIWG